MKLRNSARPRILSKILPKQGYLLMRVLLTLSIVVSLSARGEAPKQTISLSFKEAPIVEILSEIRKQTGYDFLFKSVWMNGTKPVTLSVTNSTLPEVLALVFKGQPLTYQILEKAVLIKPKPETKEANESVNKLMDVKGRVLTEKGDAARDITISVKGTSTITTTDIDGRFSLSKVEDNAILIFTSVNTELLEVPVNGQTDLLVNLKNKVRELDDVTVTVNTGYQELPRERATGSFSKVDNQTLNQQVGTNILRRLEGVASSFRYDNKDMSPGKKTNISVRGLSTIDGPQDPLIVLDGFIYEGDINNINPNIVESVTILKDAAASSIWGARAGNGVIVINTKKGQFNQKMQIDFSSNVMVYDKPDLSYLPQVGSSDYINFEQFLYSKGYYNSQFTNNTRPSLTPAVEIFRKRTLGLISSSDSAKQIDALKQIDSRKEYARLFYENAVTQQYNISLRGGNDKSTYFVSVGYDKLLGEMKNKSNRLNVKIENIYRPVKNLQTNISVYYTNSRAESGSLPYTNLTVNNRQVPYLQFADNDGKALPIDYTIRGIYTDTAGKGKLIDWKYYPLDNYKHNKTTNNLQEIFLNAGASYSFLKYFNIDFNYQYQRQQNESIQNQDIESYEARNAINLFSQLNRNTGAVTYNIPMGGIRINNTASIESQTGRAQLNFNRSWQSNEVTAIFGSEIRKVDSKGNSYTSYGYNQDPLTVGNVDFANSYKTFITGSSQFIPGSPAYSITAQRFASMYSNISYTYNRTYGLSFSARKDGSNIFGAKTNDRWKPLWSTGLSWTISNERFFNTQFFQFLKVRATYGYSGNVDLSKSAVPIEAYTGLNPFTGLPKGRITVLNDPELRWEKVGQLNIGVDFALKNQIISGSVEYYHKKGSDLYGPTYYDYTTWGFAQVITKNVADMHGKGVDVVLRSKNINRLFKWSTSLLFSYNANKTVDYFTPEPNQINKLLGNGKSITPVVGKPLYALAAFKWGALDGAGNPQGYVDGKLSKDYSAIFNEANTKGVDGNIEYIGSALPQFFGSFLNTFEINRFSCTINFLYNFGYYFRKPVLNYGQLIQQGKGHQDYEKRWQKPGDELLTTVPSFLYPNPALRDNFYSNSTVNVLKGDHIRLHYINLMYSLSNKRIGNAIFKNTQLYINLSNLGIIWRANKENLDPEFPSTLPPTKSIAFGLRTSF